MKGFMRKQSETGVFIVPPGAVFIFANRSYPAHCYHDRILVKLSPECKIGRYSWIGCVEVKPDEVD